MPTLPPPLEKIFGILSLAGGIAGGVTAVSQGFNNAFSNAGLLLLTFVLITAIFSVLVLVFDPSWPRQEVYLYAE
jgi:hypothetical protein